MSEVFKCPECGGKLGDLLLVSPADPSDPLQVVVCSKCEYWIPAHIGYRWGKITVAQTKEEWEEFKSKKREND